MAEQKNIVILFNEKSDSTLSDILQKHQLKENDQQAVEKIKKHAPFNENIVIRLTRDLMLEKISNKEFLDKLHKELKTSKETTKNLAIDIVHELVPLLEKIPEDKLEEYNRKKQQEGKATEPEAGEEVDEQEKKEAFAKAKEELMRKIGAANKSAPQPVSVAPKENPGAVKPDIQDVEENAKAIQHAQQRTPEPAPKPQEEKKADPYKEQIE